METKYGRLPSSCFETYQGSLVGRIYLIIPLKEEGCPTLKEHIERINRELHGMVELAGSCSPHVMTIICLLENLLNEDNFETFRHDVFRCCDLASKLCGGGDHA